MLSKNLIILFLFPLFLFAQNIAPSFLPHHEHELQFGTPPYNDFHPIEIPREKPLAPATLTHQIYGFLPYWVYGSYTPPRFDLISRIAYFSVTLNSSGNVSSARDWPATALITAAHAQGCKVDLCITVFDAGVIRSIVSNPSVRSNACKTICQQMALGADGVNIDFELPYSSDASYFYAFLRELADSVHARNPSAWVSVCLPAVDWRNTFNSDSLLPHLDALFLMGYGYFWSGSSTTGPIAPLDDPACTYDLAYSVNRYCGSSIFKRSRFLLGLPVYGYDWPCNGPARGASTTGTGTARIYTTCIAETVSYGCNYDVNAPCPWYVYGSYRQCWWDDVRSLDTKYRYAVAQNLMGIGWWALGYDGGRSEFWNKVEEIFTTGGSPIPRDTIIDDLSTGFVKYGRTIYWHSADTGYYHHMWWTYSSVATDTANDTCYCTWTPNLPDRRNYELFTYIPAVNAVATAKYRIYHDAGTSVVSVRQQLYYDRWVSLGTYSFEKGAGGRVYLGDGTGTAGERIGFDAIWWSDRGPLPAPDTLVPIMSDGFRFGGPIRYRRIVTGGFAGIYYWTNSVAYSPDVNYCKWTPRLPSSGNYRVFVYIPSAHSMANCIYKIKHSAGISRVTVNQSLYSNQWVYLGEWTFDALDSPYVYLGDSTGTSGVNIALDAVVWRRHAVEVAEDYLPEDRAIKIYPNPFNATCRIETAGEISIYDLTGRLVRNFRASEEHVVFWEGLDNAGDPLPAGVYLVSNGKDKTKITLIK